jgi:hypothetical protein
VDFISHIKKAWFENVEPKDIHCYLRMEYYSKLIAEEIVFVKNARLEVAISSAFSWVCALQSSPDLQVMAAFDSSVNTIRMG